MREDLYGVHVRERRGPIAINDAGCPERSRLYAKEGGPRFCQPRISETLYRASVWMSAVGWLKTEAITEVDGGGAGTWPPTAVAFFGKYGQRAGTALKTTPSAVPDLCIIQWCRPSRRQQAGITVSPLAKRAGHNPSQARQSNNATAIALDTIVPVYAQLGRMCATELRCRPAGITPHRRPALPQLRVQRSLPPPTPGPRPAGPPA